MIQGATSAAAVLGAMTSFAALAAGQAASPTVAVTGEGGGVELFFADEDGALTPVFTLGNLIRYPTGTTFSPDGSMLAVRE